MFDSVWFYLTEACNLRCSYCFNPEGIFKKPRVLGFDDFRTMFDTILMYRNASSASSDMHIVLFGGEPTLQPDLLKKIVEYSFESTSGHVRYQLITNGVTLSLIGPLISDLVARYKLRIQLSIDGDPAFPSARTENINHAFYEKSLRAAFDYLFKNSLPFTIRATLVPGSIPKYFSNFRFFLSQYERNPKLRPSINIFPEFVHSEWTPDDYTALESEVERIVHFLKETYRTKGVLLDEGFTSRALKVLERRGRSQGANEIQGGSFCGFSKSICAVSPDGDIYSCHRVYDMPEMKFGNLMAGDIDTGKMEAVGAVMNNRMHQEPHPETGLSDCGECKIRHNCLAVCPAECIVHSGDEPKTSCNIVLYRFQTMYTRIVERQFEGLIKDSLFRKLKYREAQTTGEEESK